MPARHLTWMWLWWPALWLLVGGTPLSAASLEDRLAAARLELEVGLATEERIASELDRYRASGDASPDRIALYETYLDRVRQLTEEKRKIVDRLEQALRQPAPAIDSRGSPAALPPPALDIPEDRELDELQALQRELDQSIAAFDDMLLTEGELARVQSDLKMKQLAQEAAQAARSLREGDGGGEGSEASASGMESGTSSSGGGDETGASSDEGGQEGLEGETGEAAQEGGPKETGGGRYRGKRTADAAQGQGKDASTAASAPSTVTQDDDIVARQLREAAEKETDPALKEKLWKEYYDYKKGL
jgi:hypothetical protein